MYNLPRKTWPQYYGTLQKVTCRVYATVRAYTGQGTRNKQQCLSGHPIPYHPPYPRLRPRSACRTRGRTSCCPRPKFRVAIRPGF